MYHYLMDVAQKTNVVEKQFTAVRRKMTMRGASLGDQLQHTRELARKRPTSTRATITTNPTRQP